MPPLTLSRVTWRPIAVWVLVCIALAPCRVEAASQLSSSSYSLTAWAAEKGEPPGDVFAIAKDVDGFLWLGTPTGLVRFDGSRFVRWPPGNLRSEISLPRGPVLALVAPPDGSLWVGYGSSGGVARIHGQRVIHYSTDVGAPASVLAMILDRQGNIWVAGRGGLSRYADGHWTEVDQTEGYSGGQAFSLHEDRAGGLWVGSSEGIYRRTDDRFELLDASVRGAESIAEDEAGGIWVTDPRAIVRRLSAPHLPMPGRDVQLPTNGYRLLHVNDGQLWVAGWGGGLMVVTYRGMARPRIERFAYEHRLAGSPRSLYQDERGNIWVGLRGGLLRISKNSFITPRPLQGLTNDGVRAAAATRDGSIWVATSHAVNRFSGSSHAAYKVPLTTALHEDRHGDVWIATSDQIGHFQNGRVVPVPVPETRRVTAITTDSRDRLWICSVLTGVAWWDVARGTRAGGQQITRRACQSMFTDRQDRIWIGFQGGGIAVFDDGGLHEFDASHGLAPGTVFGFQEDRNGAVWFNSATGVSRFASGKFTAVTRAHAPLVDIVPVFVQDEAGFFWVGVNSGAGILRFHPREVEKVAVNPSYQLEYALFDESDGMQQGSQAWQMGVGAVRGRDGSLWVTSGMSIVVIDPRTLPPPDRPAAPRIEVVKIDGRPMTPIADLALRPGTSTVEIEYAVVSLSASSKLRYRYMLEGFDGGWIYADASREATYSGLSPGDYRFHVSATSTGQWTEEATWAFSVMPPFYQTSAFRRASFAGILLLVPAAWWLRVRALRNQYALVLAERARVSREIHDTLVQSLAAMGMELEAIASQLDPALSPSQASAREGLRRMRGQVRRLIGEAREAILELRRTPTRQTTVVDALRQLAHSTTMTKGVLTQFSLAGQPHSGSDHVETELLRIAQEAVNNANRHAKASRIGIALAYEKDEVILVVSDDGCGFSPKQYDSSSSSEHLGLLSMRERAARVRGRVAVRSAPGEGTMIEVTLPLPGKARR